MFARLRAIRLRLYVRAAIETKLKDDKKDDEEVPYLEEDEDEKYEDEGVISNELKAEGILRQAPTGYVFRGKQLFATWPHVQQYGYFPSDAVIPEEKLAEAFTLLTIKDRVESDERVQQGIFSEEVHDVKRLPKTNSPSVLIFRLLNGDPLPPFWQLRALVIFKRQEARRKSVKLD